MAPREVFYGRLGRLILGDAREILREIPSGSVDAIITDPPWGMNLDQYDDFGVFLEVLPEIYRILKSNSWLVFFIGTKRVLDLHPLREYFDYKWMISCVYLKASTSRNPLGSQVQHTPIMVFAKGRPKVHHKRGDVIMGEELPFVDGSPGEQQFKPTSAVAALLSMFTGEGDMVLDPFAGYGSIPLVCELFNRRWIAIEIDPVKYEIAKRIVAERRPRSVRELKKALQQTRPGDGPKRPVRTLLDWGTRG